MERTYYPINEETDRIAHDMMSFSDYQQGSTTAAYRAEVDEAYTIPCADQVIEDSKFIYSRNRISKLFKCIGELPIHVVADGKRDLRRILLEKFQREIAVNKRKILAHSISNGEFNGCIWRNRLELQIF